MATRWQYDELIDGLRCMARSARGEIVVRIEKPGTDPVLWTEWGMPKLLGLVASAHQARIQTKEEDLKP